MAASLRHRLLLTELQVARKIVLQLSDQRSKATPVLFSVCIDLAVVLTLTSERALKRSRSTIRLLMS